MSEQDVTTDAPPASPAWRPPSRPKHVTAGIVLIGVVALLSILAAWDLWPFGGAEVTENAYVRGRTTVIAPQVSGYIAKVLVKDYEFVEAGQPLVVIDDVIYQARVAQAQANLSAQLAALENNRQAHASRAAGLLAQNAGLDNASAQLFRARADMARADDLVKDGSISIRERDQTVAALRQAEALASQAGHAQEIARQDIRSVEVGRSGLQAQVDAARAALRLAEIDLSHTVIPATEAGQVGEISARIGQYVTPGTQLFSLVPTERWVIANFKETQTGRIKPGQLASVTVDALGGARVAGKVERISPATGAEFAVLKPDNATGNFIKVPQRIGVRISFDPDEPLLPRLRPGMSVEARIEIGGS